MLFTPHLVHRGKSSKLRSLNKPLIKFQAVQIIPRSECSFRRIPLNGASRKSLKAALLRAQNETGNANMKFVIVPEQSGKFGGEWGYPQHPSNLGRSHPESLARIGMENGARIICAISGYEGQVFQDGCIVASRWWKNMPTFEQWRNFCRTSDIALPFISMDLMDPEDVPFRADLPFISIDPEAIANILRPANLVLGLGLFFCCAGFFMTGQFSRHEVKLRHTQNKMLSVQESAKEVLSQRRRALVNLKYVHKIQKIGSDILLLVALDEIGAAFSETDYIIARVSYSAGDLELRLEGEDTLSIPSMVSKLEAMPSLSEVRINLNNNNSISVQTKLVEPRLKDLEG